MDEWRPCKLNLNLPARMPPKQRKKRKNALVEDKDDSSSQETQVEEVKPQNSRRKKTNDFDNPDLVFKDKDSTLKTLKKDLEAFLLIVKKK